MNIAEAQSSRTRKTNARHAAFIGLPAQPECFTTRDVKRNCGKMWMFVSSSPSIVVFSIAISNIKIINSSPGRVKHEHSEDVVSLGTSRKQHSSSERVLASPHLPPCSSSADVPSNEAGVRAVPRRAVTGQRGRRRRPSPHESDVAGHRVPHERAPPRRDGERDQLLRCVHIWVASILFFFFFSDCSLHLVYNPQQQISAERREKRIFC